MAPCLYLIMLAFFFLIPSGATLGQIAYARPLSGTVAIEPVGMTGENTFNTRFDDGKSKLSWPIEVKTLGIKLALHADDLMDCEFNIMAQPWRTIASPMKDSDYINEGHYPGRAPHEGLDIYSESTLDAKALILGLRSRIYPIRTRLASLGMSAGYRYEEFDYRGYNTYQQGFGSWKDQSSTVAGPTSFYTVEHNILSLGVTMRSTLKDRIVVIFDASVLPLVYSTDEDEHLKRSRVSTGSASGSGYEASLETLFNISEHWSVCSESRLTRINTNGHIDQYWYGDDTATPNYNDTGTRLKGIHTDIDQKNFSVALGASYRF